MTIKRLGMLACRIISIYILIELLKYLNVVFMSFAFLGMEENTLLNTRWMVAGSIFHGLLLLAIAIILWIYAPKISETIVGDKGVNNLDVEEITDYVKLEIIAFSLIGIIILSKAIPNFMRLVLDVYTIRSFNPLGESDVDIRYFPSITQIIASATELLLGFVLFLKAKSIVGFTSNLRK